MISERSSAPSQPLSKCRTVQIATMLVQFRLWAAILEMWNPIKLDQPPVQRPFARQS